MEEQIDAGRPRTAWFRMPRSSPAGTMTHRRTDLGRGNHARSGRQRAAQRQPALAAGTGLALNSPPVGVRFRPR